MQRLNIAGGTYRNEGIGFTAFKKKETNPTKRKRVCCVLIGMSCGLEQWGRLDRHYTFLKFIPPWCLRTIRVSDAPIMYSSLV